MLEKKQNLKIFSKNTAENYGDELKFILNYTPKNQN